MPRNGRPSLNISKRTNTQFPLALREELVTLGKLKPLREKNKNKNKQPGSYDTDHFNKKRPLSQDSIEDPSDASTKPTKKQKTGANTKKTALQKLVERTSGGKDDNDDDENPDNISRSQAEIYEDQEIDWLEHQLGIKKAKKSTANNNWRKQFEEDGLDDLLDDLDAIHTSSKKSKKNQNQKEPVSSDDEEDLEEDEEEDFDSNDDGIDLDEDFNSEEESDGTAESEEGDDDDPNANIEEIPAKKNDQKLPSELPKQGTRYVPPQLRNKGTTNSDSTMQDLRLRKLILGQLNRLSSSNVAATLSEIEKLYLDYPRAVISSAIVELIIDIISGRDNLGQTFIVTYAALVALLCRIVGKEFVSAALSKAMYHYDRTKSQSSFTSNSSSPLPTMNATPSAGKQRANIVTFITELYNLHVVACSLVYDIIKDLIEIDLDEDAIDMLLRIVQNCGSQLRRDDPTSLKEIVRMVNAKKSNVPADQVSPRVKFMLERLSDLKGNRIKEVSNPASDARNSLKKFISQISKQRSFPTLEPLQFSLKGLRTKAATGQWWHTSQLNNQELAEIKKAKKDISQKIKEEEEAMMKLARSHGMNTDVRRSIFVNLMNSEDCLDARERILALGLNDLQKRDIVRVILHCAEMENTFNPYYPLVLEKIINTGPAYTRSLQITLQFYLWDFFRGIGEQGLNNNEEDESSTLFSNTHKQKDISIKRRVRNLSQTYAWCVSKASLPLSILKPLHLFTLQPTTESFVKNLLKYVVLYTQAPTPVITKQKVTNTKSNKSSSTLLKDPAAIANIFAKIGENEILSDGLLWFMENKMGVVSEHVGENDEDDIGKIGLRKGAGVLRKMAE